MLTFISGWAGFKTLFPIFGKYNFIVPFIDKSPDQIKKLLSTTNFNILIGWSTGAHLILKNISLCKAKYIFLISPFLNFTNFWNPKILNIMQKKLQKKPQKTVNNFLIKTGLNINYQININSEVIVDSLIKGLNFLIESKIPLQNLKTEHDNIYILHGECDQIVPLKEIESLVKNLDIYKNNIFIFKNTQHYIPEKSILKVIYETTNCNFF
ncbi:pimeloyl-[acyl-carrier protein] methyl ester esterase [Desulfonauticus submarinus]|uniref:Pimeloyl-[acyl-carrier protein] methyl ester esterase n=1 Tax=Desulfonauticus submarinus TaxID=206665 RepID=A0A1H0DM45_9BACT|nr:hypothetical protein [Desulfonauticus submarinus]SDN71116.1 pimeloyl-[acyl-carrier protein] methyl ester esterase [Desulfonauticus submarinus]